MVLPQQIICRKRDGASLSAAEIEFFVKGIADGSVSDSQIAAFTMAVFLQDMGLEECAVLTRAMCNSGHVMDWCSMDLPGPVLDKHSTGGVGDLVSLVLGPMIAACGGYVPMISGRGLGHTGGTVDKLESIPGYDTAPSMSSFKAIVREAGVAIISQTAALTPADKRMYAVRDLTGTVESIALITSSILSKKLAAGLDALVVDVKTGSGSVMPSLKASTALARSIVDVGNEIGLNTSVVLTDMNQPLANCAGNAIEVQYAIDYLTGKSRASRLHEVNLALGTEMLLAGGLANDSRDAHRMLANSLDSGRAAERFERMVAALGGPSDILHRPRHYLAEAENISPVPAPRSGFVQTCDCRALGMVAVELGGGRCSPSADVDAATGLSGIAGVGDRVAAGDALAHIHARDRADVDRACEAVLAAFTIGDSEPAREDLVQARITRRCGT